MKDYIKDILYSIKIASFIFLGGFILGGVITLMVTKGNVLNSILWGGRVAQYISFLGLFTAAISFTNENSMRPLNYDREWRTYYSKFNLTFAIFFISLFILIFSIIIQDFMWYSIN
ncbi:hypothetical protein [uncultured Clostridium sp.]|uniref:hypothetical protein n=1 Tax=uncultured Clostridium sp. TaxID=59620 RepID=UPI0028EBAF4D|nr:hypothetical protein [uncultured Clostridium sp.]